VYELVKDTNGVSLTTEGSLVKSVIIFVIIGFVLSALIIYLKTLLDNTVRDKEEFETLTGVSVIAYIDKQENYTNARK
jgi:capsular polysaccharide biosynthesis protein